MIDQEIIDSLQNIIQTCKDKAIANEQNNNNLIVDYMIIAVVIRSLIYCLKNNNMDKFETILNYDIQRTLNDMENYIKNN